MATKYCEKCGRTLKDTEFYQQKNGEKTELCKKCLTMHIDNFDPSTFLWLLEKMDVPYIPSAWNSLRDKAQEKDPDKMNGMSVFGKYLSKMKLKQHNQYGWADTEELQKKEEEQAKEREATVLKRNEEAKEKFEAGLITESEYKTLTTVVEQKKKREVDGPLPGDQKQSNPPTSGTFFNENAYISEDELPDPGADLTQEDKVYLAMKWGRFYTPSELVSLEKTYTEMMNSFDIQDADTINSLILICKMNLKMNQCIDVADYDGQSKLARAYDSARKTAKFTAAQNKDAKGDFVDCIGNLVMLCEREEGFIPRFATDVPQDKIDLAIKDSNDYIKKLVTEDLGFGQQIEDAIKKIQIQKEMDAAAEERDKTGEDPLLENEDYAEFYDMIEEQRSEDEALINGEGEDDE